MLECWFGLVLLDKRKAEASWDPGVLHGATTLGSRSYHSFACGRSGRPLADIIDPLAMARFYSLLSLLLGIWVALVSSLSLSAPLESDESLGLVKRVDSTYSIWKSIPNTQLAMGDSALPFTIDQSVDNAWGITFLYGCTALMISDPEFVVVAHMQQVTGDRKICINDPTSLRNWLANKLQPALDLHDPTDFTQVELIFNVRDCRWTSTGIQKIVTFLTDEWGVKEENIVGRPYGGGSGTGSPTPNQPQGLAVVRQWLQWLKPPSEGSTLGTLETRFNTDNPNRNQVIVRKP
ncbi:uncharacterized protein PAC_09300 [Phialocephala subalpina]|uniref:Uncharacterized protein n=1 Tax=Phialocephala subalpina TaxID=576137 RepID=A0A1L7X334_9HELO|nr:uncharacterized protein PAC_09300 [Phialocephala subalpina]